ncbi:hypothetical protein pb186bvf_000937 [Paramecium bursaria]
MINNIINVFLQYMPFQNILSILKLMWPNFITNEVSCQV